MCSAIDVTELRVPFAIEKSSIKITRNYEEGAPQQGDGEACLERSWKTEHKHVCPVLKMWRETVIKDKPKSALG